MSTNDNRRRFEELRKRLKESSGSRDNPAPDPNATSTASAGQTGTDDAKRRFEELRASLKNTGENKVSFDTWNEDDWKHDSEFINSFFTDAQKYLTDSAKAFDGISYSEATDRQLRDARNQTSRDLADRADAAVAYINKYKDVIGEEEYARLIGDIQNFRSARLDIGSAYRNQERYYGQWDTEEEYNQAVERSEMLNADLGALEKELSELEAQYDSLLGSFKEWQNNPNNHPDGVSAGEQFQKDLHDMNAQIGEKKAYLARAKQYREQFEQAKADEAKWAELTGGFDINKNRMEGQAGWDDYVAVQTRIAESNSKKDSEKSFGEKLLGYLGDIGQDTSLPLHHTENIKQGYRDWEDRMTKPDDRWNEEQRLNFGYLWKTQRSKASAYAYAVNNLLNIQEEQEQIRKVQKLATSSFGAGAAHTLGAIASSPMGIADYMGDIIAQGTLGYIPDADGSVSPFEYSQAVTGGIGEHLNTKYGTLSDGVPIIGGKGWGDMYGLGVSAAQSMAGGKVLGRFGTLASFYGSSAAAAVDDAKRRGATDEQALTFGAVSGAAETLTELLPIDHLMKMGTAADWKGLLTNVVKQGGEEYVGEGTNSVITRVADRIILGDKSNYEILKRQYIEQGFGEREAANKAFMDTVEEITFDALGGFATGTASAGTIIGGATAWDGMSNRFASSGLNTQTANDDAEMNVKPLELRAVDKDDGKATEGFGAGIQNQAISAETSSQMLEKAQDALRAGEITEAQFNEWMEEIEHQEALENSQGEESGDIPWIELRGIDKNTDTAKVGSTGVDQNMIGGNQNVSINERTQGPAIAQSDGYGQRPGADLLHGGGQRYDGTSAREQTGGMASSPEQRRSAWTDRSRATVARQNYARSLRLEKVSSLDLGLKNGTEVRNIQVIPQENWDAEMSQLADRIYNETGKSVTYVMGRIQVRGTGGVGYARGVITGDRIIVQADHLRLPMEQIADHEAYHAKVDFAAENRLDLNAEIKRHILDTFSEEQFRQVLDKYIVGLRGVIDVNETHTGAEFEAAVRQIEEEIFADAYAGINAFSAGADQFTGAVNEKMDQLYMGKIRNQDNGTEEPTGPPSDRYSFAGENANNADLDALARAKEMRSAGVADETIRQQTGWHTGMDGKWRWEIDDSGMEYSGRGDLGLRERRPEYARYRELLDKANRHALELSDEALTPEETAELQKLKNIWGGTFRKAGRITEDALPTELLSDYVKHDTLFEAYPQLRKTRLRFADLPEGTRGQYDPEQDIITLSNKLRGKPQDTLIHEIQHVIQKAEGFAQGSSPEFWEQVQKGERPVRVNDRRMAEAERKIQEILDSLPPFVAGQFELHRHLEKSDPDKAMELADDLSEGPYGDKFSDFFMLTWDLDMAAGEDNYIRGAGDLYRNTAGEIEARDAASRRQLTAEQRRSQEPARGDSYTVFMEDNDELSLQHGVRFSYAGENAETADLDARYSSNDSIYPDLDDETRAEMLSQKEIRVPAYDSKNPVNGAQIIKLKGKYTSEANEILRTLAKKCGVVNDSYFNADANLEFKYSMRSVRESINKQAARGGGAENFGKMLTLLPQLCENAVEIEAHTDKYVNTKRMDPNLKEVHVLLSAFLDGESLIPVQLEIKEYRPETRMEHKLYVTVTVKNEAGISSRVNAASWASTGTHNTPASVITVPDLIADVKDDTGDLVKYLPDAMLNSEQLQAKERALQKEQTKLADMRYEYAVENGDDDTAEQMLRERASNQGYTANDDWRMRHRAPNARDGVSVSITDADVLYGGDGSIYSPMAQNYYGEGRSYDGKALRVFTKAWGDPDARITVYRAVPKSVKDTRLRNGDWVTQTREYAQEHGETELDGDYRIVSETVPAKHLYANGDSIHELGYDNGRTDELYKNTENNVKVSGVTYDDNRKIIPLSQRYDENNSDVRYSVDEMSTEDYDALDQEFQAKQRGEKERFLRERLGDEGYEKYRSDRRSQAEQKKADSKMKEQVRRKVEENKRKLRVQSETAKINHEEQRRLQNETAPVKAKKALRNTVTNLFSIPVGQKNQIGNMIDAYADRLIKNGCLTEEDRKNFFDRMYESGVMTVPANETYAEARSYLKGGKIYVPDSVVTEFGDDWSDIRRRAFGAGIFLTRSRENGGTANAGIDTWNSDLAADIPGLFDAEDTDLKTILERIVQVAEEGKDEQLSLREYTARLAGENYVSEDEFQDHMERQFDSALRTFAESADIEIQVKEQDIRKRAGTMRQNVKLQAKLAEERQERREAARRAKERKELQEMQKKTLKQIQWLSKNRNKAPEEMRAVWDEVISDIDLYAVGAADEMRWSDKHNATWKDLDQMYKDAIENDPNFLPSKELERIVTRLNAKKIGDMDIGALQDLYKAVIGLRTEFYNRNNVINDEMQRLFAEVYMDSKREIEAAPGGYTGNKIGKFVNLEQLTPMNVLQRMAGWNPDGAFYSMAKQLEKGERDMRAYSVKAQKMLQDFLTDNADWVKKADGQGKDGIWYEVEIPELVALEVGKTPKFGDTIKVWMTPAQKVHLYLESKNQDNLRHMTGGRTFADKELYSKGKRQEALAQGKTVRLAPETVKALVSDLTPQEMELAQILDRYYNTFATQEINRVSNVLYGYDKAMGSHYAPIYTNRNYTKTEFGVFDQTAEGVGNLKERHYAANPSYNISAFDAFERHMDHTARFVGMAIPARNWTTLMNWREKSNSTGDVITHKWGEESKRYITDLITTLQAGDDAKSDTISFGLSILQSNYITAIFGDNPSIVLKQLGSIPLAGAYLGMRNVPTPAQIAHIDRGLIGKYTQELEWRTMGYSTPETKQLKENPNWTQTNKAFKFIFGGGAITAMDGGAASVLWPWAENKVRREYPELEVGTQDQIEKGESPFYKKVAEEFDNAVSRSQSVSDEIHQGSLRKSKNPITRAFTLFRSDSAQTYNALRQKIGEAKYYARTGASKKTIRSARGAAGAVFAAMAANALWSEAIDFLMALWKHKDKRYRDEEDELTVKSVVDEMVNGMFGSFAGVVTGGEELYELIGNIITGDKLYDIETPGMEQLNDVIDVIYDAGTDMRKIITDAWDILKNGGDLGDYLSKHSGGILRIAKNIAETAATYLPGFPTKNLEAYLIGGLKWVSPELGAAYDDLFADIGKGDLAGTNRGALAGRVGRILNDRNVSESDDTTQILAALYQAGYKVAVPSDTPTSVSINGETHPLGAYQQQFYDRVWGSVVADGLDELVASDAFTEAEPDIQAKMLSNLYTYAAEQAKAELFDEYELDSGATKNAAIVAAGATVAECITWNTITSEMKSGEKSAELASWDLPESAKREIFLNKISDSREDSIATFEEAGLSFNQFLEAYSEYGRINNLDLKPAMKALEFYHWVNEQNFNGKQAAVVKDELTFFSMTPAKASRYDELVEAGMDPDDAYDLTGELGGLEPEDGATSVSDLQKWRTCVDFSDDVDDQLTALFAVMTDAQYQKVEIANDFGVTPATYVTLQEIKIQRFYDGDGSYKNSEIQAAIDAMPGRYTTKQKAVLWQLATGSKSAKNNPYSRDVGQQVLDAKEATKNREEEPELPGLTLGNW